MRTASTMAYSRIEDQPVKGAANGLFIALALRWTFSFTRASYRGVAYLVKLIWNFQHEY